MYFIANQTGLPDMAAAPYTIKAMDPPLRLCSSVVKGFGRGSKLLGIPTANMDMPQIEGELGGVESGVFMGFATVNGGAIYKTVLSIGWNPQFENKIRTVEPYIMHEFPEDFYGSQLKVMVTAYLRPEMSFDSMDTLIAAIHKDISVASEELDSPAQQALKSDAFWGDDWKSSVALPSSSTSSA